MSDYSSPEPYWLYVDESGDHGLAKIDPQFPVFVLCGILVSRSEYETLRYLMNQLKIRFWQRKDVIFHSHEVRRQTGPFAQLQAKSQRLAFYEAFNELVQQAPYAPIAVAIDKNAYVAQFGRLTDSPYEIALSALVEQAILVLSARPGPPAQLTFVLEMRGGTQDKELRQHFQQLLSRGTGGLTPAHVAVHAPELKFRSKRDNLNGHQLADLLAYPIARYLINPTAENLAFDVLNPRLKAAGSLIILPNRPLLNENREPT